MISTIVTTQDLELALDLANAFRELEGSDKLDNLPFYESVPSDAAACVLAMGFNQDCRVHYGEYIQPDSATPPDEFEMFGCVELPSERDAKLFAEAVNGTFKDREVHVEPYGEDDAAVFVALPDDVTRIAMEFDSDTTRDQMLEAADRLWPMYADAARAEAQGEGRL